MYGLILVGTLWPAEQLPGGPSWLSIAFHTGAYATLAASIQWAAPDLSFARILGLVLLLGVINEGLQAALTTDRAADPWDVAADVAGGALGVFLGRLRSS